MTQELLDRINFLSRKSKNEGLTEAEKQEQIHLRQLYIKAFRQGVLNTLDNVYIVDGDGNKKKIEKKSK